MSKRSSTKSIMSEKREITPKELKRGYLVRHAKIHESGVSPERLDELVEYERKDYEVVRKTTHGTYIIKEP